MIEYLKEMDVIIYDISQDPEQVDRLFFLFEIDPQQRFFSLIDRRGCLGLSKIRIDCQWIRSSNQVYSSIDDYDLDKNTAEWSSLMLLIEENFFDKFLRTKFHFLMKIIDVDVPIQISKNIRVPKKKFSNSVWEIKNDCWRTSSLLDSRSAWRKTYFITCSKRHGTILQKFKCLAKVAISFRRFILSI